MQDILGSVRRSLVFRSPPETEEGSTLVDKINSCIRKSRVFSKSSSPSMSQIARENAPPIRWRKGELIGSGAFGRVYMGMNLDSGELLAVKEVLIAMTSASKEKAQAHIKDLEEEVKVLKNLSHQNIVRYLGTVREEDTLNILLEFVPGGSISSLLGKFGAFPEPVIRTYTKQLLLGLEYLHVNGIMHRDIKGANILVDNKGCIKLADFGASKQVVELATVTGAKSMKGTPYWMAPEVILQTGHNLSQRCLSLAFLSQKQLSSADIWSVGCTVIEMATGKPPWSQQYQEVAALFYIGTTKAHPPIPEHLSSEAKDFLLKCLQKEPSLRPAASELLQHHFVTGEYGESNPVLQTSVMAPSQSYSTNPMTSQMLTCPISSNVCNLGSLSCSIVYPEKFSESKVNCRANQNDDEMCQIDKDDLRSSDAKLSSVLVGDEFNKSFNPMCEPSDDWGCHYDDSSELEPKEIKGDIDQPVHISTSHSGALNELDNAMSYHCGQSLSEDDDILTESKITAFLDEKALELKKLQTPLYEEFYNSLNVACSPSFVDSMRDENASSYLRLPPKSRSPNRGAIGTPSSAVDGLGTPSPGSNNRRVSNVGSTGDQSPQDIPLPQLNDGKGLVAEDQKESNSPSMSFSERQRKWKEELDQELERKRELMRQAVAGGKTSSPKDRALNRRDRTRFASPGK